ncbi:MAG: hypothetical protein KIT72_04780 [Polyangiaceae bacterium]|nr:hypothetical protein [Polyangiaceae bacterium]MCW5789719.1 hypothetical protein [Polyangiaceae bacterium]
MSATLLAKSCECGVASTSTQSVSHPNQVTHRRAIPDALPAATARRLRVLADDGEVVPDTPPHPASSRLP